MNTRPFLRVAENVVATITDMRKKPNTPLQIALAKRLAEDLNALLDAPGAGQGSDFWQSICGELYRLAAAGDPTYFMRWPPIEATMVHGAAPVTFRQWWMLRRSPMWRSMWKPALRHPQHGGPPPFPPMLATNAMAIEHASHLFRFQRERGALLQDADCIIEFGGGFGSMCRLTRALGFRGRYIIFDLPPIAALQRYYLALHEIDAGGNDADVWLCADLDRIMSWLSQAMPARVSLMSTWALSEMPMAVRQRIEPFFSLDAAKKALMAYQPDFEGTDNRRYFRDLMARTAHRWDWDEASVDPSGGRPTPQDSLYVFGTAGR